MQLLKRNKKTIKYKTYSNVMTPIVDDDGYETSEYTEGYSNVKTAQVYITANRGDASDEMFGTTLDYDNIIYAELSCDIDEYSLLWIDADTTEPNNYAVKRVATSLNHKAIAVKKVR